MATRDAFRGRRSDKTRENYPGDIYDMRRSCTNKKPYVSYNEALKKARLYNVEQNLKQYIAPYQCNYCSLYHVGRSGVFVIPQYVKDIELLNIELGVRVCELLIAENHQKSKKRYLERLKSRDERRRQQAKRRIKRAIKRGTFNPPESPLQRD